MPCPSGANNNLGDTSIWTLDGKDEFQIWLDLCMMGRAFPFAGYLIYQKPHNKYVKYIYNFIEEWVSDHIDSPTEQPSVLLYCRIPSYFLCSTVSPWNCFIYALIIYLYTICHPTLEGKLSDSRHLICLPSTQGHIWYTTLVSSRGLNWLLALGSGGLMVMWGHRLHQKRLGCPHPVLEHLSSVCCERSLGLHQV